MTALAARLIHESAGGLATGYYREEVDRMIDAAFERGRAFAVAEVTGQRHCRVCGCTDTATCRGEDPCHWVARDLCSACKPFVEAAA